MARIGLGLNVFDAAVERLRDLYRQGHRLILGFSGGKDSTVVMELMVIAAKAEGRLPIDCFYADEEIVYPCTISYLRRVHRERKKEIRLRWFNRSGLILHNGFSLEQPFFILFDPKHKADWIRSPEPGSIWVPSCSMGQLPTYDYYPNSPHSRDGKTPHIIGVTGIRTEESPRRNLAIHATNGHLTTFKKGPGTCYSRPIYDWSVGDVWLAIDKFGWDHDKSYSHFYKGGLNKRQMRVALPTMGSDGLKVLTVASRVWPHWFSRVCKRVEGIQRVMVYGKDALMPVRKVSETWEQMYFRVCLGSHVDWIAYRSDFIYKKVLMYHRKHSNLPLPEVKPCLLCPGNRLLGSWKHLVKVMHSGNPSAFHTGWFGLGPSIPCDMKGITSGRKSKKEKATA